MRKKEEIIKDQNIENSEQAIFYQTIKAYSESKKLPKETIIDIFKLEIQKAINKTFDPDAMIEIIYDDQNKIAKLLNIKGQAISDETVDMILKEGDNSEIQKFIYAKISDLPTKDKLKYKDGSEIVIEFFFNDLPFKSKAAILNGVKIEIKNAEHTRVNSLFQDKIGQNFIAEINTAMKFGYDVELFYDGEQFRAFLPKNKINKSKKINPGSKVEVTLEKINLEKSTFSLEVSMIDPNEVRKALTEEIYEIENNDIEIVKIERDAGNRTKVAVRPNPTKEFNFDIIGSIFGEGAKRILAASQRVGESLDVIRYSDNKKEFIKNAISPIKPVDVLITKNLEKAFIIVKDEDVTKAIGKGGINVELASRITNINLEVVGITKADEKKLPYNKKYLETMVKHSNYEKPLFKKTQPKSIKRANAAKFLDSFELEKALSNLNDDLAALISQDEQNKVEIKPKTILNKQPKTPIDNEPNLKDIDNIFEEVNNSLEHEINNKYDFIDNLNEMFDPEFVAGDEEFENYNDVEEKPTNNRNDNEPTKKEKTIIKEYKKIKDFKVDNDLANYGLDGDIDLSEFDEDEWN
ncbi:transcription termination factor NusA [Mycoplasmopsis cynos]|uniref:NusA N-terminal domain-containing protein n=1 Tax=Mycoplasmopsis cynos TaxID=171284 RepID=UPI002B000A2C|nr:transcription termination factor NusA [Mycoplasmopsis cynos]WQQ16147.1 transcription termination factor NusA [Mycoplasmopsis cynos]